MPLNTRSIRLIAFLFLTLCAYSQDKTLDSMQIALHSYPQDTASVNHLNRIAAKMNISDSEKAITLLLESQKLATKLNYAQGQMDSYLQLGKIYSAKNQYEKATKYADQGAAIANKRNDKVYKKKFSLLGSELIYDRYYGRTQKIKDDYMFSRLKSLTLVTKLEKYLWTAALVVVILLFGFILAFLNIRKIKMQNKQLLTEQKLRRSQMNPHFIFNSIQNIRSLIDEKQEDQAIIYLNKFSALTRQILESSDESYIPLAEELELIENYLALQQLLYSNKFTYAIHVDDGIDPEDLFLPPMLSQPFIENSIKHGLSTKNGDGHLEIRFYMKKKRLIFDITDNGAGFNDSKKSGSHKSMSMEITRKRLAHYNKNNDIAILTYNITDVHDKIIGAKVSFEVPYIYES